MSNVLWRTYTVPVSLEESSSTQPEDYSLDEENASEDSPEEPLDRPLSGDEVSSHFHGFLVHLIISDTEFSLCCNSKQRSSLSIPLEPNDQYSEPQKNFQGRTDTRSLMTFNCIILRNTTIKLKGDRFIREQHVHPSWHTHHVIVYFLIIHFHL